MLSEFQPNNVSRGTFSVIKSKKVKLFHVKQFYIIKFLFCIDIVKKVCYNYINLLKYGGKNGYYNCCC